ncbi:MAG: tail fiber protein [Enterobacteriaceae bacterium]
MALTSDQERALLRLLYQQGTSLSELPAATSISEQDLLLTRQGITDKSITPGVLKTFFMTPATLQQPGVVRLSNAIDSDSETLAVSAKALKRVATGMAQSEQLRISVTKDVQLSSQSALSARQAADRANMVAQQLRGTLSQAQQAADKAERLAYQAQVDAERVKQQAELDTPQQVRQLQALDASNAAAILHLQQQILQQELQQRAQNLPGQLAQYAEQLALLPALVERLNQLECALLLQQRQLQAACASNAAAIIRLQHEKLH